MREQVVFPRSPTCASIAKLDLNTMHSEPEVRADRHCRRVGLQAEDGMGMARHNTERNGEHNIPQYPANIRKQSQQHTAQIAAR